ncbi:MAG: 5'-nucleotidase C-terminal domain-containing protein [Aestuariibaculum sp.]
MNFRFLLSIGFLVFLFNCKQDRLQLTKIEGKQIHITDSLPTNDSIENYIKPYRQHVEKDLEGVLSYAKNTYSKNDGRFNSALGNLFADAVFAQTNPVFNKRTGKNIDMVLLNKGGIRAVLNKGNITTRTAYQLMPFENSIVVVSLKGTQVDSLITYLIKAKTAHPISKLKLKIDKDFQVVDVSINNNTIDPNKNYYIATNDYLYNGGDGMFFFKQNDTVYKLDYKIRNALIDYFKQTDTINPIIDDRFIQTK